MSVRSSKLARGAVEAEPIDAYEGAHMPAEKIAINEVTVADEPPLISNVAGGPLISSAVRWGDLLFLCGRAAIDARTSKVVSDDFETQARETLRQIGDVLADAGSGLEHVLRVQCYLLRAEDFTAWNRLWADVFPIPRPARTTILTGLIVPGMLIEIEVVAGIPS